MGTGPGNGIASRRSKSDKDQIKLMRFCQTIELTNAAFQNSDPICQALGHSHQMLQQCSNSTDLSPNLTKNNTIIGHSGLDFTECSFYNCRMDLHRSLTLKQTSMDITETLIGHH